MFKSGFARVDITPPLGTSITGYYSKRYADGILDPLYLNALAISVDGNVSVFITADLLSINYLDVIDYKEAICKKTNLCPEQIFIQALHPHTSTTPGRRKGVTSLEYEVTLTQKFCDVTQFAINDLASATVAIGEDQTAVQLAYIRRYRMKDGSIRTNPGYLNPDILEPLYHPDNTVRLVKFTRENAKDIALVAFQTHPDTIGGTKFSADWPGFVRRFTEQNLDVNCIFINGCEGDCNTADFSKPRRETFEEKYGHTRFMGKTISDVAVKLWNDCTPVSVDKIFTKIVLKYVPTRLDGIEKSEEATLTLDKILSDPEVSASYSMEEKGNLTRLKFMSLNPAVRIVPVSIFAFGKIVILSFAGEAFAEYADILRQAHPDMFILTSINTNGSQGYFPSAVAFEQGGYEAMSSPFMPVLCEILETTSLNLIDEYKKL